MNNKSANSKSNSLKAKAGKNFSKKIINTLQSLVFNGIIKKFEVEQSFSHTAYSYKKQFLANFVVETNNGKYIIVRSSTSFRSDRAKIGFYDLEGIIKHSELSKNIISTVYLVPDNQSKERDFINIRSLINNRKYYCPASHLITVSEFVKFLKEYETDFLAKVELGTKKKSQAKMSTERGRELSNRGKDFENNIVDMLNESKNFKEFINATLDKENIFKKILDKLLEKNAYLKNDIIKISATNTVPLLKSGGSAKTDIVLTVKTKEAEFIETISLKRSEKRQVTCNQFSAKDCISVLDCENTALAKYLSLFQQFPTYTDFEKKLPSGYSVGEFKKLLKEKEGLFNEWVLTGKHDDQKLTDPEKQVSKFLLISHVGGENEKTEFYSMEEFISLLSIKENDQYFGVPFSWTYQGVRGKTIQLKVRIIF